MTKDARIEALRAQVSPQFIATLSELIRTYGWSGDNIELDYFGQWVVKEVAQIPPSIIPADIFDPYED